VKDYVTSHLDADSIRIPSIRSKEARMDNTPTESAAVYETVVFWNYFKGLHDPRQQARCAIR